MWPKYFKDQLIIGNLNSSIAVVTLWTPKEIVAKSVDLGKVCVIGQLYTKRGINYIIRNIFLKPSITKIILMGADLMESGKAFLDMINGKNVEDVLSLDGNIPLKSFNEFRKYVKIVDLRGKTEVEEKYLEDFSSSDFWAPVQEFPEPQAVQGNSQPSEFSNITIRRPYISDAYVEVLKHLLNFGVRSRLLSQYGNKTRELLNLTVIIEEENPNKPKLPKFLGFNKKDLEHYFKGFFNSSRGNEAYTYGERLFNYPDESYFRPSSWERKSLNQIEDVILKKLARFPNDKGALAVLWNPFLDNFPVRKPWRTPCLVLIQCAIYSKKLFLTAFFRSNDMFGAWPLNCFALRKLQFDLAQRLRVKTGDLITISSSAQLYGNNFSEASKIVKENDRYYCNFDKRGNFVISIINDVISVKHQSPEGRDIKEYKIDGKEKKAAMRLCNEIIKDCAVGDIGNAADLGRQLAKAEAAVKLNLKFSQDNPLEAVSFR